MSGRKVLRLPLEVTFEGDYYDTGELEDAVGGWIGQALEDRDDVVSWTIAGDSEVIEETGNG